MDASPKFDIVGPTVDDDVRRLFARYGRDVVCEAVKRRTARRRGRPHERDWQLLQPVCREDARLWLANRDPFVERSNASIARDFAAKYPGQSYESTHKRITSKLSRDRRYVTLCEAVDLARTDYPYPAYLRAVAAVCAIEKNTVLWAKERDDALTSIAEYKIKFGNPAPDMTMQDLASQAAKSVESKPAPKMSNFLQILLPNPPLA